MTPAPHPTIRRYRQADGPSVAALVKRSVDDGFHGHYDAAVAARVAADYQPEMLDALSADSDLRVACHDAAAVGLGGLRGGWIHGVFVDPPFQRMGIGRALITRLLSDARREHLARVRLHAVLGSEPFYERLGFRPARTFDHPTYGRLTEMLLGVRRF